MNSVGHMVKSGKLARAMGEFEKAMAVTSEDWRHPSLDSLEKALVYAMRTIANASDATSGRATELLPMTEPANSEGSCPVDLPIDLSGKNCREYLGYYHTDMTLPREYFVAEVLRPTYIKSRLLDFTYLFDKALDNPDFI